MTDDSEACWMDMGPALQRVVQLTKEQTLWKLTVHTNAFGRFSSISTVHETRDDALARARWARASWAWYNAIGLALASVGMHAAAWKQDLFDRRQDEAAIFGKLERLHGIAEAIDGKPGEN